jgi:hypothetical protein
MRRDLTVVYEDPCKKCKFYNKIENVEITRSYGKTDTGVAFLCTNPDLKSKIKVRGYIIQIDKKTPSNAILIGVAQKICEKFR